MKNERIYFLIDTYLFYIIGISTLIINYFIKPIKIPTLLIGLVLLLCGTYSWIILKQIDKIKFLEDNVK
jgi:hypothetical protein